MKMLPVGVLASSFRFDTVPDFSQTGSMSNLTQYVLLPMRGLRADSPDASNTLLNLFHNIHAGAKQVALKQLGLSNFGVGALKRLSLPTLRLPPRQ